MVKELLTFDFWISCHFVTIFRNISTFQDAKSPKALFLSRHALSKLFNCFAIAWNLSLAVNLVTSFPHPKPLKSKNKKHRTFWNTKVLSSCKVSVQTNKKCKSSSYLVIFCLLYAHHGEKLKCTFGNSYTVLSHVILRSRLHCDWRLFLKSSEGTEQFCTYEYRCAHD